MLNNENNIHAQKIVLCDKSYFMFLLHGELHILFLCLNMFNTLHIMQYIQTVETKLRTLLQNLIFISLIAKSRITTNAGIDAMHRPIKLSKKVNNKIMYEN